MQKILLIAQNQAKADECKTALAGKIEHVKPVFPGAKHFPRHFDGMLVYFKAAEEFKLVSAIVKRYEHVPVKAFISDAEFADASKFNAKGFGGGATNAGAAIDHMNKTYTELENLMRKVFAEIDADSSGFIDVKELKSLSSKLGGKAMDDSEVEECMKDLDLNKDHQISFDEFKTWWLSGKQGLSPWMRRMLGYKLSTIKFLDTMSENIKQVVEESKAD